MFSGKCEGQSCSDSSIETCRADIDEFLMSKGFNVNELTDDRELRTLTLGGDDVRQYCVYVITNYLVISYRSFTLIKALILSIPTFDYSNALGYRTCLSNNVERFCPSTTRAVIEGVEDSIEYLCEDTLEGILYMYTINSSIPFYRLFTVSFEQLMLHDNKSWNISEYINTYQPCLEGDTLRSRLARCTDRITQSTSAKVACE